MDTAPYEQVSLLSTQVQRAGIHPGQWGNADGSGTRLAN
jgi:hypothetical protein